MKKLLNADYSWSSDSLRYIHTPDKKTQKTLFFIQEIGYFKASKPYFTERQGLPSFLMKFTLSGEGSLTYANKTQQIGPGDFFFIDCTHYQYYKTISEEPWEMDWIHLYGATASAFYEEFNRSGSNIVRTGDQDPHQNPIHFLMKQLLSLEKERNSRTDYKASVLIHQLLNQLIEQKYELNFEKQEVPSYILDMKSYLEEQIHTSISLETLEKKFLINRFQMIKEFTKYIGTPPIDYFINQKLSYTKHLLRHTSLTVQEVAETIAIENPAYFSRLFKKRTGISPVQYRKTMS